jgi:hypothetical protein
VIFQGKKRKKKKKEALQGVKIAVLCLIGP